MFVCSLVCLLVCLLVCVFMFACLPVCLCVRVFVLVCVFVCAIIDKHRNSIITCIGIGSFLCLVVCLYDAQQVIYHCQMDLAGGMREAIE